MSPKSLLRKGRWIAALALCLLLILVLLARQHARPRGIDMLLLGSHQSSNGVVIYTVVLSNGTQRSQNIVNTTDGNPRFIFDNAGKYPAGSVGMWLSDVKNDLKLNLAPGACLTNTVSITNPPPRFRLRVATRDFVEEVRDLHVRRFLPGPLA